MWGVDCSRSVSVTRCSQTACLTLAWSKYATLTFQGIYIYTTILTEDCLWRKNNWNIITRIHQPCFSKFVMVLHQHQYIQLSDSGLFKSYQFSMLRIKLFRDSVPLAYCCTTEQLTRPFIGSTQAWAIIIIAVEISHYSTLEGLKFFNKWRHTAEPELGLLAPNSTTTSIYNLKLAQV